MTPPPLVVDASVVVKWFVPQPGSAQAARTLVQAETGRIQLVAPAIQRAEVANALWKTQRHGLLSAPQAVAAFERYLLDAPLLIDSDDLAVAAFGLAAAHDRSVYDCLYLALSLDLNCDFLTADRKLFRAVGRTFPNIQLLPEAPAELG